MDTRRITAGVAVLALALVIPAAASAQSTSAGSAGSRRPFRGIFGGPASPDSAHSLVFSASAFTAYDDNVLEALSTHRVRRPWLQESGRYEGATAGLNYSFDKSWERTSVRGQTGGSLRYYRRGDDSNALPYTSSDASIEVRLTRTLSFHGRQSLNYSSNYNFSLTALADEDTGHDVGAPDDPNLDLFGLRALRSATTLGLTQRFGKNTSLSGNYNFRAVTLLDDEQEDSRFHDYRSHAGSLHLRHSRQISRGAALELGYGVIVSDRRSDNGEPRVMHNVIAGVNYSRALSFSRRTSLTFGSGSAIAVSDRIDTADADPRTRARLIGHVGLVHEMGRTWTAQATYTRGFRARDGFGDLYFTDGATAGIGGLITRRLAFSAAVRAAVSSLEREGRNGHHGVAVTAQTTYALSRYLAAFASYVYYQYRYDEDIPLDPRFPRALDRQGVRVGLTSSIPLIR